MRHPDLPRPQMSTATQRPAPAPQAQAAVAKRPEAEVVPQAVMDEIRSLRKIVEQHLAGFAWGETARSEPVKTEVLRQMLDAGFSPQLARNLLGDLPPEMDTVQALAWVRGAADRCLHTVGADGDIVDRGGVFALVGPTGVGKTTTTAKLAARCVLRHGPSKVALVTTDGYRIGAHEQLRIYGRILGVPVYLVKDALELRQTLNELQHKHMVLVDTMGMSQKDKLVPEMTDMLAGCDVQRLLLLSSTSRGDTLDDVVRAYAGDMLSGCILTKIDEAASLATALDVIMRQGLSLHYVSNGQRVPEDIHLPNRNYLLHRAFKDVPENSPHKYTGVEPGLMMANAGFVAAGGHRG
jgi:flagellar biosynthesis protein FlhF